jgi:hypothetical protein
MQNSPRRTSTSSLEYKKPTLCVLGSVDTITQNAVVPTGDDGMYGGTYGSYTFRNGYREEQ